MIRWPLVFCFFTSCLAHAALPEVLECTVNFQMKDDSNVRILPKSSSAKDLKIIDSGHTENNRWIYLIRFLGHSVSDFTSEIKFETQEKYPAEFQLSATSGRYFGGLSKEF